VIRNRQLSWTALAAFSRSMARMLEAGVDVRKALQTSSRSSPDSRLTPAIERVTQKVAGGATLADAIGQQGDLFPSLYRDLVHVGEETGSVPEVLQSLAKYYESRIEQVRQFRSAITWPVVQMIAAIGIIGLLIYILGILPPGPDGKPFDVLGIGLYGTTGSIVWFLGWLGLAVGGYVLWKVMANQLSWQVALHPVLLGIPVLGGCMRSFAISRFSWCFALTQQAGMSIKPSLECSLKATGNGAFAAAQPLIWQQLFEGETLTTALTESRLFPTEYLQVVATAEETGTVPEQLDRLSHLFEDDAQRSMERLTSFLGGLIWALVAAFIIFLIFRLALAFYVRPMQEALKMVAL